MEISVRRVLFSSPAKYLSFYSLIVVVFTSGCAHKAVTVGADTPEQRLALLKMVCKPSEKVLGVRGSVWLKAKSKEASGQFPATVLVEGVKDGRKPHLKMEVTNLVGGVEALIEVTGDEYFITGPKLKTAMKGKQSWGGIPLEWAHVLFMGKIPCAPQKEWTGLKLTSTGDHQLTVRRLVQGAHAQEEIFAYELKKWGEELWPEHLVWTRHLNGKETRIEFRFQDPEEGTGAPMRWEAKSVMGEVKVRWKDRTPEY